jgi:hypothetical protein
MDDARNQSGWIFGINGRADHNRLRNEFFLHGYVAESLAVAWTDRSTLFAIRTSLSAQTITAFFVGGEAIVLQQCLKEIGCEEGFIFWFWMDPFRYRRYVRKIVFVEMTSDVVERLGQIRGGW